MVWKTITIKEETWTKLTDLKTKKFKVKNLNDVIEKLLEKENE